MEWKTVKLGEVCNLLTGFPFKGNLYAKDGIRVLRGENIGDKELHFDGRNDKRWNLPFDKIEQYSLREGDIVMQMDGNVGKNKARLLHDDIPMLIAQRVACLREKEGISNQRYLYFVITGTPFHQYLDSVKTGTSIQHISLKQIGDFELPLPPLDTQRRIAAILSSLDDKIENNNRINRNLEAQAQALFKSWFVDFEPWGGTMPEDWKEGTLGEIAHVTSGKRPPLKQSLCSADINIPLIGAADIMGYTNSVLYTTPILVTGRVGTHGIVQRFNEPCWPSDNTLVVEGKWYEYIYQTMCRIDYHNMNRGSTQPLITQTDLKNQKVIIPNVSILDKFETQVTILYKQVYINQRENKRLATLRDTLLPKLMKGDIAL